MTPCGNSSISSATAVLEAVDARDAVADGDDRADLGDLDGPLVAGDLFLEDRGDLVRAELQRGYLGVLRRGVRTGAEGAAQLVELRAHGGVDQPVAHAQDDAAEDRGVDDAARW